MISSTLNVSKLQFYTCTYFYLMNDNKLDIPKEVLTIYNLSMNGFVLATFAILAVANIAEATFVIGTTATAGAITISSGSAALGLLGGAIILKSLVLGAALGAARSRSRSHGKRSIDDENDAAFAVLIESEPAQCYKRLICDLAAGAIADNDKIVSLFDGEVSIQSPKFEYATAAKVGKMVKQAPVCKIRYSCPLSTQEIQKLFI